MWVVKYSGEFGYIKPWTAVRDGETYSQQFLTQSIVEGIEKKLFPELLEQKGICKILRHRLNYCGIDMQQERTWSKGYKKRPTMSILTRGVMLIPNLYLAFDGERDACLAATQTVCLCRNEDLLFPDKPQEMTAEQFDEIAGFELHFVKDGGFKVGYNRFDDSASMYGELKVYGNPIRER